MRKRSVSESNHVNVKSRKIRSKEEVNSIKGKTKHDTFNSKKKTDPLPSIQHDWEIIVQSLKESPKSKRPKDLLDSDKENLLKKSKSLTEAQNHTSGDTPSTSTEVNGRREKKRPSPSRRGVRGTPEHRFFKSVEELKELLTPKRLTVKLDRTLCAKLKSDDPFSDTNFSDSNDEFIQKNPRQMEEDGKQKEVKIKQFKLGVKPSRVMELIS